jgi:drug/metabolite transporter (DMT)-like permease
MFIVLGFIGITFHQWLQANGLLTAQASTTAWIVATTPIFMALFAQVWLRERLRPAEAGGILLAALGVMLVAGKGDLSGLLQGTAGTSGDLLILISAPNWALFSVLSRRVLRSHPPAMAMFMVMLAGWLFTLPVPFTGGFLRDVAAMSAPGWTAVLFLGVCCSGLAYIFWYDALEALPAARVGSLLYVEPLIAAGVAAWLLDEPLLLVTFGGGALILGGVWLVNRAHTAAGGVSENEPRKSGSVTRDP